MVSRLPFTTETVPKINDHLQERLKEVEANFANEAYPPEKPRHIDIRITFEPDKADPNEITTKIFSECKLPKRYGKKVNTVLRDGRIMVEEGPEDVPLFPDSAAEAVRDLKKTLAENGATMTVVTGGGQQ